MPTRFVDPAVIRQAFDLLVPPDASPKQYLRWKDLAAIVGLGEHWIRKRYQGRDRSELEIASITRIRKALERRHRDTPDPRLQTVIELLSATDTRATADRFGPPHRFSSHEPLRLRVVNVAFIRSSNGNYCQRLETGIRFGMLNGLRLTHLLDDESASLGHLDSDAARLHAVHELLARFNEDPRYVDRTYLVPIGTVATTAVSHALQNDRKLRARLGRDLRIIFAGVTEPEITGILRFNRDFIGGVFAGNTFADRLDFISEAFPGRKIAFLFDPRIPQELVAANCVRDWRGAPVQLVEIDQRRPTHLTPDVRRCLVTGYTVINLQMHQLVRDHPATAFIGVNTSDLGRGAVLSTGNNDLLFGIECAERLLVPDCRNEINLRDLEILRPEPVFGINQKACNLHGLIATMTARNKCKVVVD
jgi:hypothetical protein